MPTDHPPYLGHAATLAAVRAALVAKDEAALLIALPRVNWYRFHHNAAQSRAGSRSADEDKRLADDFLRRLFGNSKKASPRSDENFAAPALRNLVQSGYRLLDATGLIDWIDSKQGPVVSTLAQVAYEQSIRDEVGMSLLHVSVLVGVPNLVNVRRILSVAQAHGAVNQQDDEGDTAWHVMWSNEVFGHIKDTPYWLSAVDDFLASGARLDIPNAKGITGLERARKTCAGLLKEGLDPSFVHRLAQRVEAAAAAQRQEALDGRLPKAPSVRSPRL